MAPETLRNTACEGIQGVDLTTAGHLFNPEVTFWLANELNRGKPQKEWTQIEVYPTLDRKPLALARIISERFGLELPIPPGVTEEKIRTWQGKYPNTKVSRVHLPFSYNVYELWHRFLVGERENGVKQQVFQLLWIVYFGAAVNRKGIELAKSLSDQEAGIIAHPNVVEGFAKDGKLEGVKRGIAFVLTENERNYSSPILRDRRAIYDPAVVVKNIVERYALDGLVLGVEHGFQEGLDMEGIIGNDSVREHTRAMHLAGPHHDVIAVSGINYKRFLERVAKTPFKHSVRAALDYSPFVFLHLSLSEQFELVRDTVDWILRTQKEV